MGSDENFHRAMMQRVQSGELLLGVSRMAGANSGSIAFSRFWTLFPFVVVAGYIGVPWYLDSDLWWGYIIFSPVAFILGVVVRRNRGMAKARRLAKSSPQAFLSLWDEGALPLRVSSSESPDQEIVCRSPEGDYKKFMARHFLLSDRRSA